MSKIEGKQETTVGTLVRYNATFFQALTALISSGDWTEVVFTDHTGAVFEAGTVRIKVTGGVAVNLSFDKFVNSVQGQVAGGELLVMRNKFATSIFVRSSGAASNVEIMSWR